jgi:tetratricopeptide (TPR) repeat protein
MKSPSLKIITLTLAFSLTLLPAWAETNAEDFFQQGQIFASQKSYNKAQDAYLQALAADPKFEKAYISLALIYSLKKEFPKAIVQLDTVLKLNPKAPLPHKIKGLIFRDQGKWSEAIEAFKNYLKTMPAEQLKEKERQEIEALIGEIEKKQSTPPAEGGQ